MLEGGLTIDGRVLIVTAGRLEGKGQSMGNLVRTGIFIFFLLPVMMMNGCTTGNRQGYYSDPNVISSQLTYQQGRGLNRIEITCIWLAIISVGAVAVCVATGKTSLLIVPVGVFVAALWGVIFIETTRRFAAVLPVVGFVVTILFAAAALYYFSGRVRMWQVVKNLVGNIEQIKDKVGSESIGSILLQQSDTTKQAVAKAKYDSKCSVVRQQ